MSKNRVIVEAVLAGQSHGSVARQYGISTVWVGKLVARWRAGGWDAVEKKSTRPRSNQNATSDETVARIVALRLELTAAGLDAGPHTLHAYLSRGDGPVPSVTTIWRILTRQGLVTAEPRKRPKRSYLRFEADLPNECWQSDFTHYPLTDTVSFPKGVEIITWLDDCTRYALHVSAHRAITTPIVKATFRETAGQHGIPASTLTDNGMVYTVRLAGIGRQGGRNGFEQQLRAWNVTQKNSRPNHPTTCGKVERFQQTMKKWLRAQPDQPATIAQLQRLLDRFATEYNTTRPHRSLNRPGMSGELIRWKDHSHGTSLEVPDRAA